MRLSAAIVFGMLCVAGTLRAQEVRGTVSDSTTRQPIAGAVLTLLDSNGTQLGRNITNERGQYRIIAPRAMRRMLVVRIGYRPRTVRISPVDTAIVTLNVSMVAIPMMLEPVQVSAGAQCPRRSDRLAALSLLEQARAGLLATVVAREAKPAVMVRLRFRREMDGTSDRIVRQQVTIDSSAEVTASFLAARTARDFVRLGFFHDSAGREMFFGPDAETLLDDDFRDGYCFHLRDRDRARPNQVGLAFVPARLDRGRIGVDGTLWIDTARKELRDIVYDYVGLDRRFGEVHAGGHIEFRELANGVVLIDRWAFRLPGVGHDTVWSRNNVPSTRVWMYARESGGEVASAAWPDGFAWQASLGTLRLHVVDHSGIPIAQALLRLDETDYGARSDANGDIQITNLLPGPYAAIAVDSTLATIGVTIPTPLKFVAARDSTFRARLVVPTAREYVGKACNDVGMKIDSTTLWFIGRVEQYDGKPARRASWHSWRHGEADWLGIENGGGTTSSDGLFQYCGSALSRFDEVRIQARTSPKEPWGVAIITVRARVTAFMLTLPPPKP